MRFTFAKNKSVYMSLRAPGCAWAGLGRGSGVHMGLRTPGCTWAGLGTGPQELMFGAFGNLGFSIVHGLALAGGRCTQISDSEFWLSYDEEGPIQKTYALHPAKLGMSGGTCLWSQHGCNRSHLHVLKLTKGALQSHSTSVGM